MSMTKKRWGIMLALVPLFFVVAYPVWKGVLFWMAAQLPPCPFYDYFHIPCPGCGNTRSVLALAQGNIFSAIRFNVTPIILGLILLMLYIELLTFLFGKKIRLIPRHRYFPLIMVCFMLGYYVVRIFIPPISLR